MTKGEHAIQRLADGRDKTLGEHLLNILKAALAAAPFCGGISCLMSDYIPSRRIERLEVFAQQIADDLSVLRDRVEAHRIETDEYAFIFERCFKGASDFPQREKREAFRGILVNSLLPTDLAADQQEFYLTLVERLSPVHLRILRFMADPRGYLTAMSIAESQIEGGFSDFFPVALPGVPLEIIRVAFADLHAMDLTTTSVDIFRTATAGQGLHLLGDRLTPLAKEFIAFCQSPVRDS
jgi:hypothetical protein